uniref:Acetylserotonin O-methyltransferase n=1 Tax=Mandrillus leucophaeus TaxID=9568 RepID=A0A2K5Z716_MANLE
PCVSKLVMRVQVGHACPRRLCVSKMAGLRFEVVPSRFKEKLDKASFATPYGYAMETAKQKALEVATRMHQKDLRTPDVTVGGLILEKPVDKQDAYRMLSRLSGKEHSVFTGVAIVHCSSNDRQLHTRVSEFYEETTVKFSELSEELLWEYIHISGAEGGRGTRVEASGHPHTRGPTRPLGKKAAPVPEAVWQRESRPAGKHKPFMTTLSHGGSESQTPRTERGRVGAKGCALPTPGVPYRAASGKQRWGCQALLTACKLKVFDWLKDEAPQRAPDIASKVDASVCGTEKLLDVCAAMGLLEKTEQGYSNTETANLYLASDSEYSLHGFMLQNNDVIWNLFTYLEFAIREGRNQHHRLLGKKVEDLFQDAYYRSPETQLRFMQAMHGVAKLTARQVATAFDLSRFSSACDVGGCTGALARELAREYPRLQVTVFDLPDVVELAVHFQPAGPQIHFAAGDFFRDPLPSAELYVLCRILHDWSDDKVHKLLSKVAESCKPGAGLLLVETLLDEKREAQGGLIQSLNMLVQTEGRERSRGEYQCLLELHGFHQVQVVHLEGVLDAMLATRVAS